MGIAGRATEEGTARLAARHQGALGKGHYSRAKNLNWSSVGIGTNLGGQDDASDALVADAVEGVVAGGLNVIDSAANYRRGRGEESVGVALDRLFTKSTVQRDEVIVCTKGGYLPHGGAWFEEHFVGQGTITAEDMVGGSHSMHPEYLDSQLERSRLNLGVDTIDVHYVHNPEAQAGKVVPEVFDARMEAAIPNA